MTFLMTPDRKIKILNSSWFKIILAKGITLDDKVDDMNIKDPEYAGFVKGIQNEIKMNFNRCKKEINYIKDEL